MRRQSRQPDIADPDLPLIGLTVWIRRRQKSSMVMAGSNIAAPTTETKLCLKLERRSIRIGPSALGVGGTDAPWVEMARLRGRKPLIKTLTQSFNANDDAASLGSVRT